MLHWRVRLPIVVTAAVVVASAVGRVSPLGFFW
jgi:hypothetical protein